MGGNNGGGGNGDDDKPLFELKLSLGDSGPTMAQEMEKAREAKIELKQEIESGQHEGPVKAAMGQLDEVFNEESAIKALPQSEQEVLKKALAIELVAGKWDTDAIDYVTVDSHSGNLVCKHNDFMYTSIDPNAVLEVHQAELDVASASTIDKNVAAQNIAPHNTSEDSSAIGVPHHTDDALNTKSLALSEELPIDQEGPVDQSDTTANNQQLPFEPLKEIPEQDLTDHDRVLQNELDHLRQSLVPTSEVSQERLEQEQELGALLREVAEVEKTAEREEIVQSALQAEVNQDDHNLLRQLDLDVLEQERINQLLAEQIAEDYRYSHIDADQLEIEHTYGRYDEEGHPIYGVEVEGQRYEVNVDEALADNAQDTHTVATEHVEAMQERIAELQALQSQEQLEEERIVSRIQEIQEEQAERAKAYYAALEHQEESVLQNNEETPSFNDGLASSDTATTEKDNTANTNSYPQDTTASKATEMTPEQHITHMHNNFGFEEETTLSMQKLESAIDDHFPDLAQKDKDYLLNRLIGGFVYEGFTWNSTAGNLNQYFTEESYHQKYGSSYLPEIDSLSVPTTHQEIFERLGFSEQEYKELRYDVRIQNQISSGDFIEWDNSQMTSIEKNKFLTAYNNAYGSNLTLNQFGPMWDAQLQAMQGQGDFAHQSITTATILHKGDWHDAARLKVGSEERLDDMSGWLGDATIKTQNNGFLKEKTVQFGGDDYKADLDADNITHLMEKNDWSFKEASHHYYNDYLANGNSRAALFKEHTSYEYAQQEIMKELGIHNLADLKKRQPDAFNFLMNLKAGNHEMKAY